MSVVDLRKYFLCLIKIQKFTLQSNEKHPFLIENWSFYGVEIPGNPVNFFPGYGREIRAVFPGFPVPGIPGWRLYTEGLLYHVGAHLKALGILVWIWGPESTTARLSLSGITM